MARPPPGNGLTPLTPNILITSPSPGTIFKGGQQPETITVTGTVSLTCEDPGGQCDVGDISRVDVQLVDSEGNSLTQRATLNLDATPAPGTEQSGSWSFKGTPPLAGTPPAAVSGAMSITATLTALERRHVATRAETSVTVTIGSYFILTGSIWSLDMNGFSGRMELSTFRDDGHFAGLLTDQNGTRTLGFNGTWDENSRQFVFTRTLNGEIQTFTGFLFDKFVQIEGQSSPVLAGTFVSGGRPGFGWLALYNRIPLTDGLSLSGSGRDILTASWQFNGNGFPGELRIDNIDDSGKVTGTLVDQDGGRSKPVQGTWAEDSRQLVFSRTLDNGENQVFTGSLFDFFVPDGFPGYVLAGTFVSAPFEGGRPGFGWYANRLRIH
jgi:hypothetical protein